MQAGRQFRDEIALHLASDNAFCKREPDWSLENTDRDDGGDGEYADYQ
jgi:hypothetical protein